MPDLLPAQDNGRSSILEKVPADLRRKVDIAVVERVPPTYAGVWTEFKLGELGVSYIAFYRYARRLRDRANLAEIAQLTADDADLDTPIRKLVSRQCLEVLLNRDDLAPQDIAAIASALRHAGQAALQDRTLTENSRLAWARLEHDRAELRLKSHHLPAVR